MLTAASQSDAHVLYLVFRESESYRYHGRCSSVVLGRKRCYDEEHGSAKYL
jgi:hypothetical protein